jgi:hypothetical protein
MMMDHLAEDPHSVEGAEMKIRGGHSQGKHLDSSKLGVDLTDH